MKRKKSNKTWTPEMDAVILSNTNKHAVHLIPGATYSQIASRRYRLQVAKGKDIYDVPVKKLTTAVEFAVNGRSISVAANYKSALISENKIEVNF